MKRELEGVVEIDFALADFWFLAIDGSFSCLDFSCLDFGVLLFSCSLKISNSTNGIEVLCDS